LMKGASEKRCVSHVPFRRFSISFPLVNPTSLQD
jgi:hypothetical protein